LLLDREQQRQLDALWKELDFVTLAPVRQFKQFIWFERAEPPSFMATAQFNTFRSEDDDVTSEAKMAQLAEVYLAKARELTNDVALGVVRDYFAQMNANVRAFEQARTAAEPSHLEALVAFAARAYRRRSRKIKYARIYRRRMSSPVNIEHNVATGFGYSYVMQISVRYSRAIGRYQPINIIF
jgi:hypothetical protein